MRTYHLMTKSHWYTGCTDPVIADSLYQQASQSGSGTWAEKIVVVSGFPIIKQDLVGSIELYLYTLQYEP